MRRSKLLLGEADVANQLSCNSTPLLRITLQLTHEIPKCTYSFSYAVDPEFRGFGAIRYATTTTLSVKDCELAIVGDESAQRGGSRK